MDVSLDGMGGDAGPDVVISGAALALEDRPSLNFVIFGDESRVRSVLGKHPELESHSRVVHTSAVVEMQDKPSQAVRRGRASSMWRALNAAKDGECDIVVSAGNTGALMAMAKLILGTMPGIERPAIAAQWPTLRRPSIVLDLGANVGATGRQLADFAVMGAAMARAILDVQRPSVGLINIGVEEIGGTEEVYHAHAWLKEARRGIDYKGFIQGDQICEGLVDVIVVEGFAGNIALKTAEGTAKLVQTYMRQALTSTRLARFGALLAMGGLRALRKRSDPRRLNGGVFLGLNGIVVKSHGSTDALGFASAINVGCEVVESDMLRQLATDLEILHSNLRPADGA